MWDWRQLRWLNYLGWWPRICTIRRYYIMSRVYGFVLYMNDFIQMGPELGAIFMGMKDGSMAPVILNINQVLMGVQWAIKIAILYTKEAKIQRVIDTFANLDKRGRLVLGDEEVDRLSKYREFRCFILLLYVPSSVSVAMLWIIRPLVYLAQGEKVYILDAMVPFDTSTAFGWTFFFILQGIHVFTAIMGLEVVDYLMFCVFEMLHLQYDILKKALTQINYREPNNKLRFCISLHQDILQLAKEINEVFKNLMLYSSIIFTLVICMSIFEFSNTEGSRMKRINTLLLCFCEVYASLVICWLCQEVQDENVGVVRAAYDSDWIDASVEDRKSLALLMLRSQKAQSYGLIITSQLATFVGVIKTAFSYYQFLDSMV